MTKYLIILSLILTGCGGSSGGGESRSEGKRHSVVSDSLQCYGEGIVSATEQLGLEADCLPGRNLIDHPQHSGDVIVFGGTNDALNGVDLALFELSLETWKDNANLTCILPYAPVWQLVDMKPYRELLIKHCDSTIDPREHGIYGGYDSLHWNQDEQDVMAKHLRQLQ